MVTGNPGADATALTGVRIVSPAPREAWRAALAADPDAFATQTPEWLDCLCAARGYVDASRMYELPDGRRLVLPLVARRWAGAPVVEESMPYGWGYGGVLSDSGASTAEDCRMVLADLARRPVVRGAVVPLPVTAALWSGGAPPGVQRVPYLTQVIDLDGGFDTVWSKRFKKQARGRARKAEQFGLDVRCEHGGDVHGRGVPMFAELYRDMVDRWASQRGQPLWIARLLAARRDRPGHVAAVAAAMGDRCSIWSVTRAGEPVTAGVVLQLGRHSLAWMSAVNAELARETSATYLLKSMQIEEACRAGVRHFNMGESDAGSGVEQFKLNFGADPVQYDALRFERLPLTRTEQQLRVAFAKVSQLNLTRTERAGTS
jgi:Acetyltransferase (GNAT) domain